MPLHLLGKKSWNVYNADNIARVRRDEAAAKAAEEAEEQRMQEVDAQRRLAILRGEAPPPIEDVEPTNALEPPPGSHSGGAQSGSVRRKRKRAGEDDTDFELRIAKENSEVAVTSLEPERKATSSAPIVDHAGHIDLFGDAKARAHAEKNKEAEKDAKKKKQSFEDQYTMRFSNAAGKDGISSPWYSQSEPSAQDAPLKNVWGRDDPKRKDRDTQRIVASDPLAMMKQGASKIRELKKERKQFQEEQASQLKDLRREQRHHEKRRRGHDEGERERKRENDESPRHSDHRRHSRHRNKDREESSHRSERHDRNDSRDRRRRHAHDYDRNESKDERRRKMTREDDKRHRERQTRSPAQNDRERHREDQPRHISHE
ncbi:hypothetical protein QQX98_001419 [Neonectria punicea]|uniref:CBF1-interacting co-repressor CIR N-terminal domain-containing protein n=1 Tax=Neonectria punicea TaxID=979145 RepID=A0ABR1HPV5_9HYPO